MSATHQTLVVGGGIGGLATALGIARSGRQVRVLERADALVEIGAGLQVGPNASRAMDELGILDDIRPHAVFPRRGVMRDAKSGKVLTTLDLSSFDHRYGYPYIVLHRADLLEALVLHCAAHDLVTIETGRHVTSATVDSGRARVKCADGAEYETRALIAADGLHSTLRKRVIQDDVVPSGYAAYRGTLPIDELPTEIDDDAVVLWVAPGLHLMQYPVRGGAVYNQVAVVRTDLAAEGLDVAFANTCTQVRTAVAAIGQDRNWPMFDRAPALTWIRGCLLLVGDAAHPMLQYLGQGACQALEDAVELERQFRTHHDDVEEAYAEFQRTRMPRTHRCQTSARPWGELWHTDNPLTVAIRNRYFALRRADDLSELDWLYARADVQSDRLREEDRRAIRQLP
ncbi:3-hydroxybenzoate 6-hydroxylase [Streptomyces bathyalis]|uniref:3-hydroxybenzoate 6-hydroxylase n=1 Tax=Streptomyces bathyalis TaxID=2710756 RepID=A0A7T1WQJ1_9ACTN|nr:FAD-dependent monooxygenase [Streptomyces bathyalis]QPP05231.1 3-hydroxybenzoate 6-hydroxylase [Streptomyces bathyalis]